MKKKKSDLPEVFIKALCAEIKACRLDVGISQDELATQADLHRTYVSLIERKNANFSMHIFFRIAQVLNVSPTDLMSDAEVAIKGKKHPTVKRKGS